MVLLTACSAPDGDSGTSPDEETFTIGIAAAKVANPAANLTYAGIKAEAERLGMEVRILDSNLDINKQVSDIDQLTASGADAIFVHLVGDPNAVRSALQRAADAGVLVNGIDGLPTLENVSVIADQSSVIMATQAVEWVGEQLGGEGQVACTGSIPIPVLEIRVATCEEVFREQFPNITVVPRVDALPDDAGGGRTVGEQLLVKYPDLDAILSVTDIIGAGTAAAVNAADRDVLTTGLGASPESVNSVKAGAMSMVLDPKSQEIGAAAVQQVYDILTGKTAIPSETIVVDSEPDLYTKANIGEWIDPTTIVGVVS
ncbi:sugar ABC transporter substrate-binding protein [Pseudolysinimonas sp.]|uniref:sugar ABC transporter substrate-binding protein n=1 Tax=Pseudolysinimonas sp. TaxID=2680009 RepID=UPI003C749974